MSGHEIRLAVIFVLFIVAAILMLIAAIEPAWSGRLQPLAWAFAFAALAVALGVSP